MKKRFASLLALCLTLSLAALPAAALETEDAKKLLQQYYVDGVPEEILSLDSLDEILEALGDPYTVYWTAEEYQKFLTAVNGESVVGIGVSISTTYDNGYPIMSILPDSPALEAGLEAGDRVIAVDGVTASATSDIRTMIGGEAGTPVTITVIRASDGQQKDYTMIRRAVVIPIVTYDTAGDAGLIDCSSFGDSTVATVEEALKSLNDDVSIWIIDLRSNPGGTSNAAAGSAGLFVGSATMVYFRDANGNYSSLYTLPTCPDLTDKPLIVLTSPHSASGSELFAAAARDHGFGIAIGQRTFGKGIAQIVLDDTNAGEYFDGDALKVTAYRFYSPDGTTNHTVGVIPTLMLSQENTPAAALLLSAPQPKRASGFLKLDVSGQTFYIDLEEAQTETYSAAFTELLEALPPSAVLSKGSSAKTWTQIAPTDLAKELGLPHTARSFTDIGDAQFEREINTLAAYQLLGGYGDGTFRPENTVTRAEFCAMVATALDLPAKDKPMTFSDTNPDAWYVPAVSAMAARGYIAGFDDGTFRPNDTITYEQMVTILASVAAWCNMDGYDLAQQEVPAAEWPNYYQFSEWAQPSARVLDHLDALVGGQAPTDNGTRQVAAGMLCTLMENIHLLWD